MPSRVSRWSTARVESFPSERALCDAARAPAGELGWTFYPETGGWDFLLVLPDETQIGVQAKQRANVDVLAQAIGPGDRFAGPDVHAVLVPSCSRAFRDVAERLDVLVIVGDRLRPREYFSPREYLERLVQRAPRRTHLSGRCWLPPFVPEGPAGVPAPRAVSKWRVDAARLCDEIRRGLQPTNAELARRGMSMSTWRRWLDPIPGTRPRRYALRPGEALPDVAFPEVCRGLGRPDRRHDDPEDAMPTETRQQQIAAFLEEAARLLRAHPELFTSAAMDHVGVGAGLALRVTRMAARQQPLEHVVRDVASTFVEGIARVAGLRKGAGLSPGYDRNVLLLLAGARRGYVRAAEQITTRMAQQVAKPAAGAGPQIDSACPRCGERALRDLASPAPCAPCGFVFESVEGG